MTFYKYNGAGNDFLVADNRDGGIRLDAKFVSEICDRHYGVGADGVMLLGKGPEGYDFSMDYYNSDGSGGMMCGNGGRCIVAFAAFAGLKPSGADGEWSFVAADGPHRAHILSGDGTVRLKMSDISIARRYEELSAAPEVRGWFIDTGTRHFVTFTGGIPDAGQVEREGRRLRHCAEFAPEGANINFVQAGDVLNVRTFEKGVEAETCACGTGIVASAAASWLEGVKTLSPPETPAGQSSGMQMPAKSPETLAPGQNPDAKWRKGFSVHYDVHALNDTLAVDFTALLPCGCGAGAAENAGGPLFTDVWLTGPTSLVAEVKLL